MRVQPHGFRINRDHAAKIEPIWQVIAMEPDGHAGMGEKGGTHWSRRLGKRKTGAQERTRTFTALRPQVPETCASTNSATWAKGPAPCGEGRALRGERRGVKRMGVACPLLSPAFPSVAVSPLAAGMGFMGRYSDGNPIA